MYPSHGLYEQLKRLFVARNPGATPQQYQQAMTRIARQCGV